MDPVNAETFSGNAFRTLGISGSSGQSQIEAAARRMRIWPDPARIPPTPWDLPVLGPVRRSRPEIERAVSLLNQPGSRLEHRLLWFDGDRPPGPESTGTESTGSELPVHAAAVADLIRCWTDADPLADVSRWSAAVARVAGSCRSDELSAGMMRTESAGGFDKRASVEEVAAAIGGMPEAVAAGLIRLAVGAIDAGRFDAVPALAEAIRRARLSPGSADPAHDLLERVEDLFNARCAQMERDLRDNLSIDRQAPHLSYAGNHHHASRAADFYDSQVSPLMGCLGGLAASDADRLARLRGRCGELLVLLALGWEWAGQFSAAEQQLQAALEVSLGTGTELSARRELARVTRMASGERDMAAAAAAAGPVPTTGRPTVYRPIRKPAKAGPVKFGGIGRAALIGTVLAVGRAIFSYQNYSSNPTASPNISNYNFGPQIPSAPKTRPEIFPDPAGLSPSAATTQSIGDDFREP